MAQRERLPIKKFLFFVLFTSLLACKEAKEQKNTATVFQPVDVSQIPTDTVNSSKIEIKNGIVYLQNKPFSGFVLENYAKNKVKGIYSYFNGKLHGISQTFYENEKLRDKRSYKNNLSYGKHIGFWDNGNQKFEYFYIDDRHEGTQKEWYNSGVAYKVLHYTNDREDGRQQAWRENGKPYINYEVRNGIRYGLQKAALCYTLKNEELKKK